MRGTEQVQNLRTPNRKPSEWAKSPEVSRRSGPSETRSGRSNGFSFTPEVLVKAHEAVAKALAPLPDPQANEMKANDVMTRKPQLGTSSTASPGPTPMADASR